MKTGRIGLTAVNAGAALLAGMLLWSSYSFITADVGIGPNELGLSLYAIYLPRVLVALAFASLALVGLAGLLGQRTFDRYAVFVAVGGIVVLLVDALVLMVLSNFQLAESGTSLLGLTVIPALLFAASAWYFRREGTARAAPSAVGIPGDDGTTIPRRGQ